MRIKFTEPPHYLNGKLVGSLISRKENFIFEIRVIVIMMKVYLLLSAYLTVVYGFLGDCPRGQELQTVFVKCAGDAQTSDCTELRQLCLDAPELGLAGRRNSDDDITDEVGNTDCPAGQHAALVYENCPAEIDPFDCSNLAIKCAMNEETVLHTRPGSTELTQTEQQLEKQMMAMSCPSGQRPYRVQKQCSGVRDNKDCKTDIGIECRQKPFANAETTTRRPIGPLSLGKLEYDIHHMSCPFGQRPAYVKQRCPPGARDTLDCPQMEVRCVPVTFGNEPLRQDPVTDNNHRVAAPKSLLELEQELLHKVCPPTQRTALVKEKCPYGTRNLLDCPTTEVRCVRSAFGLEQPGATTLNVIQGPAKTLEELERDMMNQECPAGERPAIVKESCPSGATDPADCPNALVRCVQMSFANNQPATPRPLSLSPRAPARPQAELDYELMHKICPAGYRAAQVKEKCPYSEFDTWFCPHTTVRCLQIPFGSL